jgi:hypothetical protein
MLLLPDKTLTPSRIAARTHFAQECLVRFLARKVMAAAPQQRLLHPTLETMMALFGVTVLVTLPGVDRLRPHLVVPHQRLVPTREKLRPRRLHCQAHPVAAVLDRHAPQRPHGVLKTFAEALETLGETERHMLPVRVRQDEVVHQVRERLAADRHAQIGHVREVRGTQPARQMFLREENLLVWPARGPPVFDPPLHRSQMLLGELPRMAALQFLQKRLGFPARTLLEQGFDFAPDASEGILAGPVHARARLRRAL